MTQNQSIKNNKAWNNIIIVLSVIGLMVCITLLFPQIRRMILDFAIQILHKEPFSYETSLKLLSSLASGLICFILFFDYCTLTNSGRALVKEVKQEIKDCLSEIDYKIFIKPVLLMSGIYLLGIFTIIRANVLYFDDIRHSIDGHIEWYNFSRYISVFNSIIIHGDINITDISPLPQLLAILILSCSSVLLVFVLCEGKITTTRLLASIPLGLSPFFLECLSYKFYAPNFALSILASIVPFLFIVRKKAFLFVSVISLLFMCMTYQGASGIFPMITIILCFQYWNSRKKTNKEILSFIGMSVVAFCFSMLFFRLFLMKSVESDGYYATTKLSSISHIIPNILNNIQVYVITINQDFGIIWKTGIIFVCVFFITKSISVSSEKKAFPFFISILVIASSFILSFGAYIFLETLQFSPRVFMGFGVFLAILCVNIVSDYKKSAIITVLALNWCFFVFAFSYGNALADQARYATFREGLLLHDLNALYTGDNEKNMKIQIKNSIDFAPTVKNIAKHYLMIEKLVPKRLAATNNYWEHRYFLDHYNYNPNVIYINPQKIDFDILNLPVVLDSYYHTIKSDGENILVILKH